jgi:flagellar hook assembly protein FlgD
VEYSLAREAEVRVGVYDVLGQRVRVLVSGLRPAGRNRVFWDGLDGSRRRVADGAYFLRLESAGRTLTAKLVLAR